MARPGRIDAFEVNSMFDEIDDIIKTVSSEDERKKLFVDFAREEIAKADAGNAAAFGSRVPKTTSVNGVEGAPIESIRLNGSVITQWMLLDEVIKWVGAELLNLSPVLTGKYQRSHVFLVDDVPHDPDGTIPAGDVYAFVNTQPYARKIERGLSKQAPQGVYRALVAVANQQFGNIARISFSYRSYEGSGDRETRNPAITIRSR